MLEEVSNSLLQPRVSKLQHKFPPSTISPSKFSVKKGEINMGKEMPLIKTAAPPLFTTAPMLLYSVSSTPLPNEKIIYYDALRHNFTTSKTTMSQRGLVGVQPNLQVDTNFQETLLQPIETHLSPSESAITKSKNLRKFRYGLLPPEKANILAKDLVNVPKRRLIQPPAGKGNDLIYFDSIFPSKSSTPVVAPESPFTKLNNLGTNQITPISESEDKIILTDRSSQLGLNATADQKLTIRRDSGHEYKYKQKTDNRPVTPLYTPATFRLPIKSLRIDYDKVGETIDMVNKQDQDEFDTAEIRRTLGVLEIDGSVDGHTKEEFFQHSKMIAKESDNSVEVHFLPFKAPATAGLQEGRLDIIDLSNIVSRDILQESPEETAASPQQPRIDKSNSNGKIKPKEKAAIALSGPQRPVKTTGKLCMRRAAQSKSSSSLSRAAGSPAAGGKVLPCSQCVCQQATLWCSQCAAAYCGICWLRSPAHSKTDIFPMQSSGPKPPYFTVDAFNEESHIRERIAPSIDPSNPIIHKEFKTHVPSSKSQHFLNHHHDFERTAARKPEDLMVVNEYRDYPLPPVYLDSSGDVHHFQSRTVIRPFSTPDFRSLKSSKSLKPEVFFRSLNRRRSSDEEDDAEEGEEERKIRLKGLEKSFSPYSSRSASPMAATSEHPHLVLYNNLAPKLHENSSGEGDSMSSEEKASEAAASWWLLHKKPLHVKSSWKQEGKITNPVPAAYSIAGGGGGAIHVAYSSKPSLVAEPITLSTIDMTGWAHSLKATGIAMDDSIVSGTNESGDNANQYEIINGRALYMAPVGRTEEQIREENTLREIRKQGEMATRMHPRAFRLP